MNYQYVLPTRCQKCGTTFDLYYELLESEERIDNEDIQEKLGQKLAESLCWGCKQQLLTLLTNPSQKQKETSNLDDFFLDLDVEFE